MCGGLLCEVFLVGAVYGGLDMGMEGWIWVWRAGYGYADAGCWVERVPVGVGRKGGGRYPRR